MEMVNYNLQLIDRLINYHRKKKKEKRKNQLSNLIMTLAVNASFESDLMEIFNYIIITINVKNNSLNYVTATTLIELKIYDI